MHTVTKPGVNNNLIAVTIMQYRKHSNLTNSRNDRHIQQDIDANLLTQVMHGAEHAFQDLNDQTLLTETILMTVGTVISRHHPQQTPPAH